MPRFVKAGYPSAVIACWGHEGVPINFGSVPVYGRGFHPWGMDVVEAHSKHFGADICFSLVDAWVMDPQAFGLMRWVPWFPVDHDPIPAAILARVREAFHRLVYSKHAAAGMDKTGMEYDYVPHGIETNIFKPSPITDDQRKYFGLPKDRFIVGMVAANKGVPPRKAFFQQLTAFAALQKKHGDCLMYLHTYDGHPTRPEQVDLVEFAASVGLKVGKDVIFAPQHALTVGFPDDLMAILYSAFDVLTSVSMGEGFGLPIVEAQSCGTPVIVGDWTSMSELCFSGWKVDKKDADPFWTPLAAYQYLPHAGAIAERMEDAYQMRDNQDYRRRARDGALAYDADRIMERYWLPVLKKLEEKVNVGKGIPNGAKKALVGTGAKPVEATA